MYYNYIHFFCTVLLWDIWTPFPGLDPVYCNKMQKRLIGQMAKKLFNENVSLQTNTTDAQNKKKEKKKIIYNKIYCHY